MAKPPHMLAAIANLQTKINQIQKEMANASMKGTAGGNMVVLEMNGRHEIKSAFCDPEVLKEDPETVCDLFIAAFNDANRQLEVQTKKRMGEVTKGLLPAGLSLPGF